MSVSKISGKLTFVMLLALALGGCVVASGSGEEDPGSTEKVAQPAETTIKDQALAADSTGNNSAVNGGEQVSPDPVPWVQPPPAPAAQKVPVKPHVEPSRTEPYPE